MAFYSFVAEMAAASFLLLAAASHVLRAPADAGRSASDARAQTARIADEPADAARHPRSWRLLRQLGWCLHEPIPHAGVFMSPPHSRGAPLFPVHFSFANNSLRASVSKRHVAGGNRFGFRMHAHASGPSSGPGQAVAGHRGGWARIQRGELAAVTVGP
jgi:hypothetical protein